jgi:hypothetical protein
VKSTAVDYTIMILPIVIGLVGGYLLIKKDWKRYGLVYLLNGMAGNVLCYTFVFAGFYSFPKFTLNGYSVAPYLIMLTFIPFTSLLGKS